jgi:hypothetical protein
MSSDDDKPTSGSAGSYAAFRQRLDAVLRQRDPAALRAFLVAEGQWEAEAQTDAERALWMMIATSPALAALHGEAREWLLAHGHVEEANALFGGRGQPGTGRRGPQNTPRGPGHGRPRGGAPGPRGPQHGGRRPNEGPHRDGGPRHQH